MGGRSSTTVRLERWRYEAMKADARLGFSIHRRAAALAAAVRIGGHALARLVVALGVAGVAAAAWADLLHAVGVI